MQGYSPKKEGYRLEMPGIGSNTRAVAHTQATAASDCGVVATRFGNAPAGADHRPRALERSATTEGIVPASVVTRPAMNDS